MGYHPADLVARRVLPARTAALLALALLALLVTGGRAASAQSAPPAASGASAAQPAPHAVGQGVAVLGVGASRAEAYALARAVYGSSMRPRGLDEIRARVLAGDPAPSLASREVRELAELRAAITGEDAASRRLLASIAQQLGVAAILVVRVDRAAPAPAAPVDAGAEDAASEEDAGATAAAAPTTTTVTSARLFLADTGELDAARYSPDPGAEGSEAWRSVVTSLERRFAAMPAAAPAPAPAEKSRVSAPTMRSNEGPEPKPFYTSAWFWGAIGAAVLVGGAFYFASRDTSDDPIHLQMRVPR